MTLPAFQKHLRFAWRVEELSTQKLTSQCPVEGFVVASLPRRARCDEERFDPYLVQLLSYDASGELLAVVRTDVPMHATVYKVPGQRP